jgi:ubiquinone/menaquinone biosynthesis C-methylase UbiE
VTPEDVPEAFDEVADRYDLMVALSPGYHRQLRSSADALVLGAGAPTGSDRYRGLRPLRLLDLGCGSGASTRALADAVAAQSGHRSGSGTDVPAPSIVAVDASDGMLNAARAKSWPAWVTFASGRAEAVAQQPELAGARAAGGLDGVFAAYLVRNVDDRDAVISAIHDELRPGGVLVVHDYSVRGRPMATAVWTAVCWGVIVPLGWLTSHRTRIYRYLWRSVLDMDSTAQLEDRLRRAGFEQVATRPVRGWQRGTVHTVIGRRPVR